MKHFVGNLVRLAVVACVLGSSAVFAQEKAPTPAAAPASDSIRVGRKVTVDGGYGYSNGLASFAFAGYHVSPDWVVEGYYEDSSTFFFGQSITRGLRSKNFWSPKVYTNLGILYRQTRGENRFLDMMTSAFTGKDTTYEIRFWDVGPEFTVGTQWTWGGFHVGCDWVGVYWPLYYSGADITLIEDGARTTKSKENFKPDPSARLIRLYAGLAI